MAINTVEKGLVGLAMVLGLSLALLIWTVRDTEPKAVPGPTVPSSRGDSILQTGGEDPPTPSVGEDDPAQPTAETVLVRVLDARDETPAVGVLIRVTPGSDPVETDASGEVRGEATEARSVRLDDPAWTTMARQDADPPRLWIARVRTVRGRIRARGRDGADVEMPPFTFCRFVIAPHHAASATLRAGLDRRSDEVVTPRPGGSFTFDAPDVPGATFVASAPGRRAATARMDRNDPEAVVDLLLLPPYRVQGQVTYADGTPAARCGIAVHARLTDRVQELATTLTSGDGQVMAIGSRLGGGRRLVARGHTGADGRFDLVVPIDAGRTTLLVAAPPAPCRPQRRELGELSSDVLGLGIVLEEARGPDRVRVMRGGAPAVSVRMAFLDATPDDPVGEVFHADTDRNGTVESRLLEFGRSYRVIIDHTFAGTVVWTGQTELHLDKADKE